MRPVRWRGEVSRDLLAVTSKNSLGAISTLFLVPDDVFKDVERARTSHQPANAESKAEAAEEDIFRNIQAKALEFTKDRVSGLDWSDMQELVAGLLRALGYKTRVSPAGPDRGKDIVASPDGFGFEAPRIVVEVKHRQGTIGAQEVRSFLGGRHPLDKGLYVSTGGFTKDAYYEAERANIPLALMTIDELVESLVEHYEKLDLETQQLVPLKNLLASVGLSKEGKRRMPSTIGIVGFNSAWTDNPKAPGAVCSIRVDRCGSASLITPSLASFDTAFTFCRRPSSSCRSLSGRLGSAYHRPKPQRHAPSRSGGSFGDLLARWRCPACKPLQNGHVRRRGSYLVF